MKGILIATLLAIVGCQNQATDEYFESGNAKKDNQDYEGAIADFSKVIDIDPSNAMAWLRGQRYD